MQSKVYLGHLSDLHIGGNAYKNRIHTRNWWVVKHLQSDNPHDDDLASALSDVWSGPRSIRNRFKIPREVAIPVAISGDLTRRGFNSDFELAKQYVEAAWLTPKGQIRGSGLRLGRIESGNYIAIPGNHDQWDGRPYWFAPVAFHPFPFRRWFPQDNARPMVMQSPDRTLVVEVYSVDSNSGHIGKVFRPAQGGSISRHEFARLRRSFDRSSTRKEQKRVRVILCHHGFDSLQKTPGPLDASSRETLIELAAEKEVAVILTGHTHYADWKKYASKDGTDVWEIRASTPLQAPKKPPPKSVPSAPRPQQVGAVTRSHSFWVHEIAKLDHGSAVWRAHMFQWGVTGPAFDNFPPIRIRTL